MAPIKHSMMAARAVQRPLPHVFWNNLGRRIQWKSGLLWAWLCSGDGRQPGFKSSSAMRAINWSGVGFGGRHYMTWLLRSK